MFLVGKIKYMLEGRCGYGFVKPAEADLHSGMAEINAECRQWEEGGLEETEKARLAEMPFWRRVWEKTW